MRTLNRAVACTPYPTRETRTEVKSGLPVVKQLNQLTKLKVLFDADDGAYVAGDEIFVRGDAMKHPHAAEVWNVEGVDFVLVPYEFVKGVKRVAKTSEFEKFQGSQR